MDELSAKPLNQAHIRARKAAGVLEKGDRLNAIKLYREVNELLCFAKDLCGNDETIMRSIQLQIEDVEWKIRALTLKDLAEFKKALGVEEDDVISETRKICFTLDDEEDEDDGVVLINSSDHLDFCENDALFICHNSNKQDRLADIPFNNKGGRFSSSHQLSNRISRSPSLPEGGYSHVMLNRRMSTKSDAPKEDDGNKATLRMHHEIWSRQNLI